MSTVERCDETIRLIDEVLARGAQTASYLTDTSGQAQG
jgi:hypothetical protein